MKTESSLRGKYESRSYLTEGVITNAVMTTNFKGSKRAEQ